MRETDLLRPVAKKTVPKRVKSFTAEQWYLNRHRLCISDTFADRLDLRARQTVSSVSERPYAASLLKVNAYDRDIRKELPVAHLSRLEDIAALIEAQSDGMSGILLTNGYANIFYVEGKNGEVFVVDVFWDSYDSWNVFDMTLDEFVPLNIDSCQVFYPGNAVLLISVCWSKDP